MIHIGPPDRVPLAERAKAMVTLVIGDSHRQLWETCSRASWERWADAHGYDLIALTEPLDTSSRAGARSPAWQKCLMPTAPWAGRYRRLVWVDADIVVGPRAGDVTAHVPFGMVGGTLVNDQCSSAEKELLIEYLGHGGDAALSGDAAWGALQRQVYESNDVKSAATLMIATGVLVLEPAAHASIFLAAYDHPQRSRAYEQPALSALLLEAGVFHQLSPRWNWGMWDVLVAHFRDLAHLALPKSLMRSLIHQQLRNAYFLHFYQCDWLLRFMADEPWGPEGPDLPDALW